MSRVKLSTQRLNLNTICSNPVMQTQSEGSACGLAGLVIPIPLFQNLFFSSVNCIEYIVLNLIAGLFGHQKDDNHGK